MMGTVVRLEMLVVETMFERSQLPAAKWSSAIPFLIPSLTSLGLGTMGLLPLMWLLWCYKAN